ncbi:MAG: DNA polymerase III subunit alpha [Candidatus Margulisiibacteriota bacterium]
MSSPFVHLHCHTEYSLLEAPLRIAELIDSCKAQGMPAVAMTDNGSMFGCIQFYLEAQKKGIKPIIGCEMYITDDITQKERGLDRLILLCENYEGYQSLIQLVTTAHLEGFYYKPRIDLAHLAKRNTGLIAIAPGGRGPASYALRSMETDRAKAILQSYKAVFGDRFYLGIQKLDLPYEDIINDGTLALSKELDIPVVLTNDVYYLKQDQAYLRDILNCIQTGRKLDENTRLAESQEHYLKSSEAMAALFPHCPEAYENAIKIADRCNLKLETEQVKLPRFECPDGKAPEAYMAELVWEGLAKKYGTLTPELEKRANFELDIMTKMQYAPYFLIIYDFLNFCRQNDIPVGPGRGSAAGSIVAYALDITNVDPIEYNLLFERFLNPERVSMPDIDLDFCIRRRGEVIAYIVQKYGADHVSQIATFGTMAARGVIRDVGRALDVPLKDVDYIAKLIPSSPGQYTSIPEALEQVPELKKMQDQNPQVQRLLEVGAQLEGLSRHTSMHAAGVVISRDPLSTVVPLIRNEGQAVTQYSMTDLEKIGLLKMDILGLRNLTVMDDAVKLIKRNRGIEIDLNKLDLTDSATYDMLCSGETTGIFQLESSGMRRLIKDLKPRVFEDIIALLALYRPGPLGSGMVSDFISNKSGETQVKYDLPELEPILKDTYGLIVYQEQVMQIASVVAGFSLGEADVLRRAMGKKKKEEMDKMRDKFMDGAETKQAPLDKAEKIFDLCYKFAEYGFNKSHSAAYALISFQTAYLKTHFAVEYLAALLSSILGSGDRTSLYIQECKRMNIAVLPPDVNSSESGFTILKTEDTWSIRFGLGAIKNVGEGAIESIVSGRDKPYANLDDFCKRVDLKQVNKRVIESLIKAGAMDGFGSRGALLGQYEVSLERAQTEAKERANGQIGLFGDFTAAAFQQPQEIADFVALSTHDLLRLEKELLGLYISGHPLDTVRDRLERLPYSTDKLRPEDADKSVVMGGMLSECRRILTRNKKEMVMATLEDFRGSMPVFMFYSESFEKLAPLFQDDHLVQLKGRVRVNQDEISLMVDDIHLMDHQGPLTRVTLDLTHVEDKALFLAIRELVLKNRGGIPLCFQVNESVVQAHKKFWVSEDKTLLMDLEALLGAGQVLAV